MWEANKMKNGKRYIVPVLIIFIIPSRKEKTSDNPEEHKTYKSIAYVTVLASEH